MSDYDFELNPRAWQFTGELKAIERRGFFGSRHLDYQWVFEKVMNYEDEFQIINEPRTIRIGVMYVDGRLTISDPPAGE